VANTCWFAAFRKRGKKILDPSRIRRGIYAIFNLRRQEFFEECGGSAGLSYCEVMTCESTGFPISRGSKKIGLMRVCFIPRMRMILHAHEFSLSFD
jgi:hypothetical protein